VFLGEHSLRLDDKGRLVLPAKYREELAGGLVITKSRERCLYVFPQPYFLELAQKLQTAAGRTGGHRGRMFFSSASEDTPDKQGRVTVPQPLREYAGLARDCTVVGNNDRLEIWDTPTWETYLAEQENTFSEAAEEVLPGVL
jgi:MraZ protein